MTIRVLLVEDDLADVHVYRRFLEKSGVHGFELEHADRLSAGLERLLGDDFQVLLLDLGLPDSRGLGTFTRVHREFPEVPIIVLSGNDDEELAFQAVREGAQDYLVKSEVTAPLLARAIRYALERHQLQQSLTSLSLIDELTGLYNRRGFHTLAGQQLKNARRSGARLSLVFADLDGLKRINDELGHHVGDRALAEAAEILRRSFRDSDILARIGGDEFAVLLVDVGEDGVHVPLSRLKDNLRRVNEDPRHPYPLSMSTGLAVPSLDGSSSLEELVDEADRAMYRAKRGKKRPPPE